VNEVLGFTTKLNVLVVLVISVDAIKSLAHKHENQTENIFKL